MYLVEIFDTFTNTRELHAFRSQQNAEEFAQCEREAVNSEDTWISVVEIEFED